MDARPATASLPWSRSVFRPAIDGGLRIADGFVQHLLQFSLRLRGLPRFGSLPVCHRLYVGMNEAELNPRRGNLRDQAGIHGRTIENYCCGPDSVISRSAREMLP
jgi:hypothetical protein